MSSPIPGRRAIVLGFGAAVVILLVLVYVVGVGDLVAAVSQASPLLLFAVFIVGLTWLVVWGLSFHVVLRILDVSVSRRRAVVLYSSVVFANDVMPFAQLGAEPFAAFTLSRSGRLSYRRALVSVAGVDTINLFPSSVFVVISAVYLMLTSFLPKDTVYAAVAVVLLAVATPVAGYAAWRQRETLSTRVAHVVVPVTRQVTRLVPSWSPPTHAYVRNGVDNFFDELERLAADRRGLAEGLLFSAVGWALLATSLWLSLRAVGVTVSPAVPLLVVPMSNLAVAIPLPGGVGGVETALVLLLVSTTGIPAATATAATLIHRGGAYFIPLVLGGISTAMIQSSDWQGSPPT